MSGSIASLITNAALANGIDPNWALAVAQTESGLNPDAASPAGAIGVMQLMPQTAQALGVDPKNIQQNIEGGVKYLAQNLKQFGNPVAATAAYNAGPTPSRWDNPETNAYVPKVIKAYQSMTAQQPAQNDDGFAAFDKQMSGTAGTAGGAAPVQNDDPGFAAFDKQMSNAGATQPAAQALTPQDVANSLTTGQNIGLGLERGIEVATDPVNEAIARGVGDVYHAFGGDPNVKPGQIYQNAADAETQAYNAYEGAAKPLSAVNVANVGAQLGTGALALATGEGALNTGARRAGDALPIAAPALANTARFITGNAGEFSGAGAGQALLRAGSLATEGGAGAAGFDEMTGRPITPAQVALGAALGPVVAGAGALGAKGVNALVSGATPAETRAAQAVYNAARADGGLNPASPVGAGDSLATVGGQNVQGVVEKLANKPGPARSIVSDYFDNLMQQQPQVIADAVKGAMGSNGGVSDLIDNVASQRASAAAPLYEKAFAGGSLAPLESQFQNAFNQAGSQVAQAQKELESAKAAQILAAGKQTQTAGDVYSTFAANQEAKTADGLVQQAQTKLTAAQQQKDAMLAKLQQAQADGTANAPGAVWSPRIQQFLDDPLIKAALPRGIEEQRLESLANGTQVMWSPSCLSWNFIRVVKTGGGAVETVAYLFGQIM